MNITKTTQTLTTWLNTDTGHKVQYESDTDTYYYFDNDDITASWESSQNSDIIALCQTKVTPIFINSHDFIPDTNFILQILCKK
jgi:hypothetical protein